MAARDNGKDPFRNFRFKLELGSIQVAGFSECTGLQIQTKVFEYKEGGNNQTTLKFPEHTSFGNVTLKRGVTTSNDLIEWQFSVVKSTFDKNSRPQTTRSVTIVLMNDKGENAKRWVLKNAFPVKWVGPDLKASANEIAIETLEIAYEGIEIR